MGSLFLFCFFHSPFLLSLILEIQWTGTNVDIMKVGGYKLSALEIEAVILEASATCHKVLFLINGYQPIFPFPLF